MHATHTDIRIWRTSLIIDHAQLKNAKLFSESYYYELIAVIFVSWLEHRESQDWHQTGRKTIYRRHNRHMRGGPI